ncbi:MAG: hypothetical protein WCW16_00590 [Candidatus Magasanikbacteria bacterium]|jgi:hypothetical protein
MKNKTKGILFIIIPILGLVFILSAHAVTQFILQKTEPERQYVSNDTGQLNGVGNSIQLDIASSAVQLGQYSTTATIARIVNMVLGLLGIIAVVGILIGIPIGIYLITRKEFPLTPERISELQKQEKYKMLTPEQIRYIHQWSWGAFFGRWIWSLGNKLYMWTLGFLVPFFNLYVWIKLSIDGRKMAWEQKEWDSFEQFKKRQTIIVWILISLIIAGLFVSLVLPETMSS